MSARNSLPSPVSPMGHFGQFPSLHSQRVAAPTHQASGVDTSNVDSNANVTSQPTEAVSPIDNRVNASSNTPVDSTSTASAPMPSPPFNSSPSATFRNDWLPFTFRFRFLIGPIVASLAFGIALAYICWYSRRNYGLGKDDGSSGILFGWRFTPTLVAVLYTQATVILFEDAKRTEPFARLASAPAGGAPAYGTLLQTPKAWWAVLIDLLFRRKRMGKTSWAFVCSLMVYLLALLLISPLSSALLASEERAVAQDVEFSKLVPADDAYFKMKGGRESYFRTISAKMRNISTSAWVTDHSITLPFWPTSENMQMSSQLMSPFDTWQADTITYSHEYSCQNMTLVSDTLRNLTYDTYDIHFDPDHYIGIQPMVSFVLKSADNCTYELDVHPSIDTAARGGAKWHSATDFMPIQGEILGIERFYTKANVSSESPYSRVRASPECNHRDIILINTPWTSPLDLYYLTPQQRVWPNQTYHRSKRFRMRGLLCDSTYYSTKHRATVIMEQGAQTLMQNVPGSENTRKLLTDSTFNQTQFQEVVFKRQWNQYATYSNMSNHAIPDELPPDKPNTERKRGVPPPMLEGMAYLLQSEIKTIDSMIDDPLLAKRASAAKGRFFAENIRDSLAEMQTERVQGTITLVEERIITLDEVAIALSAAFFLSFLLLLATLWFCRLQQRPLNLPTDPSSTVGMGALLNPCLTTMQTLRKMHDTSTHNISKELCKENFFSSNHTLYEGSSTNSISSARAEKVKPRRDWRPFAIRFRNFSAIAIFLALLLTCILLLSSFSSRSQLYQKAFTYEADLSRYGLSVSTFAPISIGPTLISIAVTLWWDQIDMTLRLLQPYISMAQSPTPICSSTGVTYRSKTWMGAAIKAARHRHWLLCLVALGSTLCQVLTVSMSALFERQVESVSREIVFERAIATRQVPFIKSTHTSGLLHPREVIAQEAYKDGILNWLHSASIDLSLGIEKPSWTAEEWSFTPVNLTKSILSTDFADTGRTHESRPANVSILTTAMRARLICEPLEDIKNTSLWLMELWPDEKSLYNDSSISDGHVLVTNMFQNSTKLVYQPSQCCANGTDNDLRRAVVGKWVHNETDYYFTRTTSMIVEWVVGNPRNIWSTHWSRNNLLFPDLPRIQAAACRPVFDQADATVNVDRYSGTILSYNISSAPALIETAWSEEFIRHATSEGHAHYNRNYTGDLNVTTSFGNLFINALLTAAGEDEEWRKQIYNIRDESLGLNFDFMAYGMYNLVHKDVEALLNYTTLVTTANRTLQTFFQHFVHFGLDLTEGNWAYQKIGDRSLADLGIPVDYDGNPMAARTYASTEDANRTVVGTVSESRQVLRMNKIATYLSVGIVIWLIATTAVLACFQQQYTGNMMRNVELISDVLVLVAGSDNFLSLVQEKGLGLKQEKNVKTRLGWFRGRDGEVRWGVEVVGGRNAVEWVDAPQKRFS